jgi:anaerobic magnesium-protoporphyrin IX monomethyl ester cyclase
MAEIELLYRDWGIKDLMFQDDTFNANRQWADRLLDLIIAGGYNKKLVFRVAMRVNEKMVDLDLLKHLKAAGVWIVYYGIENGNQDMMDRMHKDITVEEVKRAFVLTKGVGLKVEAGFLIGMPGETPQTIQDSCNLWKTIKPYWGGFSRVIPFPGTPFSREVKESGHLLSEDYENFQPSSMVVRTDAMSAKELDDSMPAIRRMVRLDEIKHPKQVAYLLLDKVRGKE